MAARKQTSDRVSRIAGRVLERLKEFGPGRSSSVYLLPGPLWRMCSAHELKALAASCLGQDETKGKRKARRK